MATAVKFKLSITRLESQNFYSLAILEKEWNEVRAQNAILGKELDQNYKSRNNNAKNVRGDKSNKFSNKVNQYPYAEKKAIYEETEKYLDLVKVQLQNVIFFARISK